MEYRCKSHETTTVMKALEVNYELMKTESIPFSSDLLLPPRFADPEKEPATPW